MTCHLLELSKQKCRAISECWLPDNKILCGCDGNELVTVDFESDYVTIVNKNEIDGKDNHKFVSYPASIYMLKVNNRNTRTRCEICSKLTIKTPERRHWHHWRLGSFWCH